MRMNRFAGFGVTLEVSGLVIIEDVEQIKVIIREGEHFS